jgi:hypothetical protein
VAVDAEHVGDLGFVEIGLGIEVPRGLFFVVFHGFWV